LDTAREDPQHASTNPGSIARRRPPAPLRTRHPLRRHIATLFS
jgi:hypothetical protein